MEVEARLFAIPSVSFTEMKFIKMKKVLAIHPFSIINRLPAVMRQTVCFTVLIKL